MATPPELDTSTTLLRRLSQQPVDELAWNDFVDRYAPLLLNWSKSWGLQAADAEDVAQSVLVELARQMKAFQYDHSKSFRGWLRTIARRTWYHFLNDRPHAQRSASDPRELFDTTATGDSFLELLEQESRRELLEIAMDRVRRRVHPHTWEAFRLLTLEERSGMEVAQALGMNVGAVFVAGSKVRKMLREVLERLDPEGDEEARRDEPRTAGGLD